MARKDQNKDLKYTYSILDEPCEKVVIGGELIFINNDHVTTKSCRSAHRDRWNTYAGVPIKKNNGEVTGILAVMDALFLNDANKTLMLLDKIVKLAGIELHHRELSTYFSNKLPPFNEYEHSSVVATNEDAEGSNQHRCKTLTTEINSSPKISSATRENCLDLLVNLSTHEYDTKEYLHRALTILTQTIPWLPPSCNNIAFVTNENNKPSSDNYALLKQKDCLTKLTDKLISTTGARYCANDQIEKNSQRKPTVRSRYYLAIRFEKKLMAGLRLDLPQEYVYLSSDESFLHCVSNILSLGLCRLFYKEKITFMSRHDALTTLPNRKLFLKKLMQEQQAAEIWHHCGTVLFIDMDRFKALNDALGSKIGDQILIEISRRLNTINRYENYLARLGADEFSLLLPCLAENREEWAIHAIEIAKEVLNSLSKSYLIADQTYQLTASIGMSVFDHQPIPTETILSQADTAMGVAKRNGGNQYIFFCPDMQKVAEYRVQLESYLHSALEREELFL